METNVNALWAWMKTRRRPPDATGTHQQAVIITSSIDIHGQQSGNTQTQTSSTSSGTTTSTIYSNIRHEAGTPSETFEVNLPLKSTVERTKEAPRSNRQFKGFIKVDMPITCIVDGGFVRLYDYVKNAIRNGEKETYMVGLHPCFGVWLRLIFELLASPSADTSGLNIQERHLFFIDACPDSSFHVYFARHGVSMVKIFKSIDDAHEFVCGFGGSIVIYNGSVNAIRIQAGFCFILGKERLVKDPKEVSVADFMMATSFPVFKHFVKSLYKSRFDGRDMLTFYHICSGDLNVLDQMIADGHVLFTNAHNSIESYIGSPKDDNYVVKIGKKKVNQVQFDEVPIVVTEVKIYVATTIVLCEPANHREDKNPVLVTSGSTFPKPASETFQNLYILSPSKSMFADSVGDPIFFPDVQLPGYFTKDDAPLNNDRWHLAVGNESFGRLSVKTQILFSLSTKILYAMVEALAQNVDSIQCRSWHITGIYGTGKSTALLTCQYLWFKRPSSFRVAYLPHANMFFAKKRSLFETFKLIVFMAFLRDPVQHLLFDSIVKNVGLGKIFEKEILTGLFLVLQKYLESRNLFFVIIIDQLNKIWDKSGDLEKTGYDFIESSLRPMMREGTYKRILLITAASLNNSAAPSSDTPSGELNIDFFNGFNEFESDWMIDRFIGSDIEEPEKEKIKALAKSLGVRPIDNDFLVGATNLVKGGGIPATPTVTESVVSDRIVNLKDGIVSRFGDFTTEVASQTSNRFDNLVNVLYLKLLNSINYNVIDRRVVKPVLCPRHWDKLKDHVIIDHLDVDVMPLPVNDMSDFEDWLRDPNYREALSTGPPRACLLPCSQIARQAFHDINLKWLCDEIQKKLLVKQPGAVGFVFEDAFEDDVVKSDMRMIRAFQVKFESPERAVMDSNPTELFNFRAVTYHENPLKLTSATPRQVTLDLSARLQSVGIKSDGRLHIYRMRLNERAIDFSLIQKQRQQEPQVVVVQTTISRDHSVLKTKFLRTLCMLCAGRKKQLPILYAKGEKAKVLFVCGPNFFGLEFFDDKEDQPPPLKKSKADTDDGDKGKEVMTLSPNEKGKEVLVGLEERRVLTVKPSAPPPAPAGDEQPDYKKWTDSQLMGKVFDLVRQGLLEVYVVPVEDEPVGSYDIFRYVYKEGYGCDT